MKIDISKIINKNYLKNFTNNNVVNLLDQIIILIALVFNGIFLKKIN